MEAGELLALCRELKGLTLRDVEKATGLSNAFISQIETGKVGIGFVNAVKLCDFYGITLERLADTIRKNKASAEDLDTQRSILAYSNLEKISP